MASMASSAGVNRSASTPLEQPSGSMELGEYRLLEKLGEGGMGSVYKALHTRLDRIVALKMVRRKCEADESVITRFDREMKAVGRINHPNVIQAYDAREIAGTRILVTEFVDGMDLAALGRRHGRLPIAEACEIARQAALGLQAAHQFGLVHRDIKPSNLMLARSGVVKVLDLGLARIQLTPLAEGELTTSGQIMGTADFMAPEQVVDCHHVDIRADIYSLGCTLYKLLVGEVPFSGPEYDSLFAKMTAHVMKPVRPIRQVRDDVPVGLASVIDRMLAKAPADRFATPAGVAEALAPFAKGCDLARLWTFPADQNPMSDDGRRAPTLASPNPLPHDSFATWQPATPPPAAAPFHTTVEPRQALAWRPTPAKTNGPGPVRILIGIFLCALAIWVTVVSLERLRKPATPTSVAKPDVAQVETNPKTVHLPPLKDPPRIAPRPVSSPAETVSPTTSTTSPKKPPETKTEPPKTTPVQETTPAKAAPATQVSKPKKPPETKTEPPKATPVQETTPAKAEPASQVSTPEKPAETKTEPAKTSAVATNVPLVKKTSTGKPASSKKPPLAVAPFDATKARSFQEQWASHLGVPVEEDNSIGMKLVLIPPGEFRMGQDDFQGAVLIPGSANEMPSHPVVITQPFRLGATEVTQQQFQAVMGADFKSETGSRPNHFSAQGAGKDKVVGLDTSHHPVEMVEWSDAAKFCDKLSELPAEIGRGHKYRLPTEAEWEYACRAGTTTTWFCGSDSGATASYGWFSPHAADMTQPVGKKKPNPWGLHDMVGNVHEWCRDWFDEQYYQKSPKEDPPGPSSGMDHVARGGAGFGSPLPCRSTSRVGISCGGKWYGFRVLCEVSADASAQGTTSAK
jgi:formylglycine-generating enzyme required for sulfatase activity/serine/threonine protein kinase